jgi:subtilase family serine protease
VHVSVQLTTIQRPVGISPARAAALINHHPITIAPQIERVLKDVNTLHFGCQDTPIDSGGVRCYQPAQIQTAYGITPLLNARINGSGRTIAIIDAFQNPYLQSDLSSFDSIFGLPDPQLSVIAPHGLTPFDPTNEDMVGWAEEISLDVLEAHAMAPGAKILLVLAPGESQSDLYTTTKYVVDHNLADVITQSFGNAETCVDPTVLANEHRMFEEAKQKRITVFASSGDSGAAQFNCDFTGLILSQSYPASDPLVTGVGGTTLNADANTGAYIGETAWTEPFGCPFAVDEINCSGGGFSTIYPRPDFQSSVVPRHAGRGVPDISYDAGFNGGVIVHCGPCLLDLGLDPTDPNILVIAGGTSAGSPQWAGLIADGDQLGYHRLGDINPALYTIANNKFLYRAALHDITIGNNDVSDIGAGYDAVTGWDPVTGLGTPNAARLLPLLAALTR